MLTIFAVFIGRRLNRRSRGGPHVAPPRAVRSSRLHSFCLNYVAVSLVLVILMSPNDLFPHGALKRVI